MDKVNISTGTLGCAKIEKYIVEDGFFAWRDNVPPGEYTRLMIHGGVMMSDTPFEMRTNWKVVREAKGNVLIAGLGIGLILKPILEKDEVSHVTVIEKYQEVIDLVYPNYVCDKLTVICADIMEWKPNKDQKFDTIYFDIWPDVCTDNLKDMSTLHRKAGRWKTENAWIGSWMRDSLKRQKARESKHSYGYW